jgi:hypothetical protein
MKRTLAEYPSESVQGGAAMRERILKYLEKLQMVSPCLDSNPLSVLFSSHFPCVCLFNQMELTLDELRSTQAAEAVSDLRKHFDAQVASKARAVRTYWKDVSGLLYMSCACIYSFTMRANVAPTARSCHCVPCSVKCSSFRSRPPHPQLSVRLLLLLFPRVLATHLNT